MFKKFLFYFFFCFLSIIAIEKKTTFTFEDLRSPKNWKTMLSILGKILWKMARQTKILNEAQKIFPDVIFLSYEQLNIKICKIVKSRILGNNYCLQKRKEVAKEIGSQEKRIYSLIKKKI
ncbi:MAG: hypothetical protein Ct9H300mP5_6010 [Candidatus Pelagibacterales bacterium]|nr:MAG: hypothetical protein Ct9H300mP5_6010 [Pelagibacterales bacterium]